MPEAIAPVDLGVKQLLEGREQDALKLDGQRQQPVEEGGDRRQIVFDAIVVHQLQAGRCLEPLKRAALDLAAHDQKVELAQRITGIEAFEIVLGPEQPLPAGLALPAGDGAQRVEAAGDGAEESASPLSHRSRSGGTAVAVLDWSGWCGQALEWRHRPSSLVPADNGRAGAGFLAERSA